ncbi:MULTISPECIES: sulfurtransferase [Corynebacterium]|uniref:sulfurtransferase n=1 Tax=Corynebacterium TaxID=1716 RepID=UPI00124C3CE6|nr:MULTISPECIES: sulfurtransferase [Corynebacterium]
MNLTITPDELADRIRFGRKTTLLASFWRAGEKEGLYKFNSEHIPTSLYCDTAHALAGVPSSVEGRNPLPDAAQLARWFVRWGINTDQKVVVYDEGNGLFAARAWWVLTWAGVQDVRVLDGGMAAWEADGHQIIGGPGNLPMFSNIRPHLGNLAVADYEDVQRAATTGDAVLIDCRSRNRFAGRKEFLDLKAGHIPGSVNIPVTDFLTEDNRYRSPEDIREIFDKAGITPGMKTIMISGSGVHSSQAIFAMHLAGLDGAALYPGGWSQWCADASNPVERGDVASVSECVRN